MLWREVTSREFQTINIQGAGVGEVLLEGGGQGDEGEGRGCGQIEGGASVPGSQLTLSRAGSQMGLSTPSS